MWKQLKNIRRIRPYVRPHRKLVVTLWVFTALGALVALLQPWPFAFLVDGVIGNKGYPGWLGWLRHRSVPVQIGIAVGLTIAVNLLGSLVTVISEVTGTKLELNVVLEYRAALFRHAQRLSLTYHDTQRKGSFIYQINFHAHSAGSLFTAIPPLVQALLTLLGMFFITYSLDPKLALLAALIAPLLFFAVKYYARYVQTELYRVRNVEGESMSIIHESMSMIWIVVANARERYEHRKFRDQARTAIDARVRLTMMQTVFSLVVSLITTVGTGLVIFFGAQAVISKEITLGQLLIILAYVAAIYRPMEQISTTLGTLQETLINLGLSFDLLDTAIDIEDGPLALAPGSVAGHIVFEHVSFSYPRRADVLQDINFEIRPGERVAIVGPTGAGKSTLMTLLARFSDPESGRILLDGHDLRDLNVEDLRNCMAFVLQEPVLFQGSVMNNIRYGRLDATDDEVVESAKAAGAHDFIQRLPNGYHTEVGERGALLSGGERQRLCVARAFVRDAPVLILDEPTSSIDTRTEQTVLDALDRLAEGRTTFLIAHRLSTIRNTDRILVVDGGRIVEAGTQAELLALGGLYASLAGMQHVGGEQAEGVALPPAPPAPSAPESISSSADGSSVVMPAIERRRKVVVLGMITKIPVAGVVWQAIHYLVGLERLGIEAYYVESHARTPSMFTTSEGDSGAERAASFLAGTMARIGLEHRWAYHALHDDGRVYGMSAAELQRLYRDADLIINLHGGTMPLPEHSATGRLVYLETDPGQLAVELHDASRQAIEFLEPHVAFFTFAENWGRAGCGLPPSDRFDFVPTRQPVVCDFWEAHGIADASTFTTIGSWRQPWREVHLGGETYHWSKHLEFERFIELPSRSGQSLELALSGIDAVETTRLVAAGWRVRDALEVSGGLNRYRSYIANSRGEFTVAKDQNVRLRTGWFSDRSATYLAAGRPVVTQDTGFGDVLPTGAGLFAVDDVDGAVEALAMIEADERHHRRGAVAVAHEFFDHAVVLRPLLASAGLDLPRVRDRRSESKTQRDATERGDDGLDLEIMPVSRRPLVLPERTVSAVLSRPLPHVPAIRGSSSRRISVVAVTRDQLAVTRLCLESVLTNSGHPDVELVVVDNASSDLTPAYLRQLADAFPQVQIVLNDDNRGYAAGLNQGLAIATGQVYVVINNDVIVAPGWLHGLAGHLDDPSVGMVGPVTNAAPNAARVDVGYRTYGEFIAEAAHRSTASRRQSLAVPVLTLFCAMLRRETYRRLGPFDEQFGLGMFEDDDYAMRLREAGLHMVVAEDTLVHHFGEAAFGALVPTGEYGDLFQENRRRFEKKWGTTWEGHQQRRSADYTSMVERVQRALINVVPAGEVVAVVAKGDRSLLELGAVEGWQFPQDESGEFDGAYPADSGEAIVALERLRARGARYVAFPATARWWLEHYTGLRDHLRVDYEAVVDDDDCLVLRLRAAEVAPAWA